MEDRQHRAIGHGETPRLSSTFALVKTDEIGVCSAESCAVDSAQRASSESADESDRSNAAYFATAFPGADEDDVGSLVARCCGRRLNKRARTQLE